MKDCNCFDKYNLGLVSISWITLVLFIRSNFLSYFERDYVNRKFILEIYPSVENRISPLRAVKMINKRNIFIVVS